MNSKSFPENVPFANHIGVEISETTEGYAEGSIELQEELCWGSDGAILQNGVIYTLAEIVGKAAFLSLVTQPVATIDMQVNHLENNQGDVRATAEIQRLDRDTATAVVDVYTVGDQPVAEARAVYKNI